MASSRHDYFDYDDSSSDSGYSDHSYHSRSTAPTEQSDRPYLKDRGDSSPPCLENEWDDPVYASLKEPRASADTYASTVASDEFVGDDHIPFDIPECQDEYILPGRLATTPDDFSKWFPTTRRLHIAHDDSTLDGNMNLQVYTDEPQMNGKKTDLTLFHLRMHDLKNRQFSLRRYCRDSGREVCHSSRKYTKPAASRPGLQRSMSNALNSLRSKSDSHSNTMSSFKRVDSGYGSLSEEDFGLEEEEQSHNARGSIPLPTNTTHLEFSNYSHVDVKRRGAKSSKRYEFEYWGEEYTWKRVCRRSGSTKETSYHLVKPGTTGYVANIIPAVLTPTELEDEEAKGGWIPPCTLRISDPKITSKKMTDLAE